MRYDSFLNCGTIRFFDYTWSEHFIPENYYNVKIEIEKLFNKEGKEKISKSVFEAIARKNGAENIDELLKNLNALGICLWYPELGEEINTLVLNPEWITNGVYKVINWTHEEKGRGHHISLTDFERVFADDAKRYTKEDQEFIFLLMKKYELAYEYMNSEGERGLIIPHLLKEDRPEKLPDFPTDESLELRYKANLSLPSNTISRFIVRHNTEIRKENNNNYLVWRYGVVLDGGNNTIALVREEDRTIQVKVKGANKTVYISELRETLNDIFSSYKSEKPELQYKIESLSWRSEEDIVNHYNNNRPIYDSKSNKEIPPSKVIKKYNIKGKNITIVKGNINTFNFKECSISLQGDLNSLSRDLKRKEYKDEAKELEYAVEDLKEAESITNPEEIKRKGLLNKMKQILEDLGNKNSKLHKIVSGIDKGIDIAQRMGKSYNKIAQWTALPTIPDLFLGK